MLKLDETTWVDPSEVEMMQITHSSGTVTLYTLCIATRSGNACNCSSTEKDKLVEMCKTVERYRTN